MKIYTFNNKIMTRSGKWMERRPAMPVLPPYTIRLKFTDGVTPTFRYGTGVQVSSSPNIWDLTYENTDWSFVLFSQSRLLEVIDANTTGVTNMESMFGGDNTRLTTVPLFDTSAVTITRNMFSGCSRLTSIPLFNTSVVTEMGGMFYGCTRVESGALALYQQASSQATVPEHTNTFRNCGSNTTTGAAELAQIPSDWK